MGQPIPNPGSPDSGIPLVEGLSTEWNDVIGYIPEDKRGEVVPKLKEWDSGYTKLKAWEDFQKSGIDPQYAQTAIDVMNAIENQPQQVYEAMKRHYGFDVQPSNQSGQLDLGKNSNDDTATTEPATEQLDLANHPDYQKLKNQYDTMAQILLSRHQEEITQAQQAEEDAKLDAELKGLKDKYGDFPEKEVVRRMIHDGMSSEEAYQDFVRFATELRRGKPAPYVLGGSGPIPREPLDPKKMDSKATKDYVMQLLGNQD